MMMMITMPKLLLCRGGHLICLSSGYEACYCSQIIHVYSTFNEHKRKFCDSQERKKNKQKENTNNKILFFYRHLWLYHNGADFGNWKLGRIKKLKQTYAKQKCDYVRISWCMKWKRRWKWNKESFRTEIIQCFQCERQWETSYLIAAHEITLSANTYKL